MYVFVCVPVLGFDVCQFGNIAEKLYEDGQDEYGGFR